jgi:hypothetical protein
MSKYREDGWSRHDRDQARIWRSLSYLERLHWLEDAKRFTKLALDCAEQRRIEHQKGKDKLRSL